MARRPSWRTLLRRFSSRNLTPQEREEARARAADRKTAELLRELREQQTRENAPLFAREARRRAESAEQEAREIARFWNQPGPPPPPVQPGRVEPSPYYIQPRLPGFSGEPQYVRPRGGPMAPPLPLPPDVAEEERMIAEWLGRTPAEQEAGAARYFGQPPGFLLPRAVGHAGPGLKDYSVAHFGLPGAERDTGALSQAFQFMQRLDRYTLLFMAAEGEYRQTYREAAIHTPGSPDLDDAGNPTMAYRGWRNISFEMRTVGQALANVQVIVFKAQYMYEYIAAVDVIYRPMKQQERVHTHGKSFGPGYGQ